MTEVFYGLGRHHRYLSPYNYAHYLKFDYLDWIQVFATLALSKISVCQFLLRLSKFDRLRRFLQGLIVFIILTHIPLTLLMIFQCHPVQKYWNQSLPGSCFRKDEVEKIVISQGGMCRRLRRMTSVDSGSDINRHRRHWRPISNVSNLECRHKISQQSRFVPTYGLGYFVRHDYTLTLRAC